MWQYEKDEIASEELVQNYLKKRQKKPVSQYDLNDNFLNNFESASQAASYLGLNIHCSNEIGNCCKGKIKKAYGYKWKYTES